MTHTSSDGPTLRQWRRCAPTRVGRWLFARIVCRRAPYFSTITPRFLELRPGCSRVSMPKRRMVENHIGTVHAIAMANLVELAAGMVTEVTIPPAMRWIPRGMTIEYRRRAESDLVATARLERTEWPSSQDAGVPVSVHDAGGTEVVRAVVTMYVTPRRDAATR